MIYYNWVMNMASRYKFSEEEIKEIEQARRDNKDKRAEARLKALELRAKGADAKQVSRATGFHASSVSRLVAKYRDHGLEAISGNHYGGNHRNMSIAEEAAILAPFQERAERRCMLIARTFKSSLLQRWSAHLWQNGMAEARSGIMNKGRRRSKLYAMK